MKHRIAILLLSALTCGCDQENNTEEVDDVYQPNPEALELNNKAVNFIGNAAHSYDSIKGSFYDSALIYLNEALQVDSLYITAYTNKAQVLRNKGQLKESIDVLEKVESIKPGFVEVIMGQGLVYEKMGNMSQAHKKYNEALEAYKARLEDNPDPVKVKLDIAFLYIFLEDKHRGMNELEFLKDEYPDDQQIIAMEGYLKGFNKEEFIKTY